MIVIQQEVADKIKETKTNKAKQMGTELIMGMEEVINYLKELEAENKLLKDEAKMFGKAFKKIDEENKKLKEKIKEYSESDKHLNKCINSIRDQYLELKEENNKLSEDYQKNSEASDILEDDGKEWNGNEWVDEEPEQYKESEIDYYIDAARKVVLKDGRTLETNDDYLSESDEEDEEEKCEECGKCLEGEDKCGEGCPSYDKGWNETHEEE